MTAPRYGAGEMREGADWCERKADAYQRKGKPFEAAQMRSLAAGLRQAAETQEALQCGSCRARSVLAETGEVPQ